MCTLRFVKPPIENPWKNRLHFVPFVRHHTKSAPKVAICVHQAMTLPSEILVVCFIVRVEKMQILRKVLDCRKLVDVDEGIWRSYSLVVFLWSSHYDGENIIAERRNFQLGCIIFDILIFNIYFIFAIFGCPRLRFVLTSGKGLPVKRQPSTREFSILNRPY